MLSAFLVSAGWMRTMMNCAAGAANSGMRAAGVGVKLLCVLALGASLGIMAGPTVARAQVNPADLLHRIERLESQIRQMTGDIEQLQYRNQQLEAALSEMRYQDPGTRGARVAAAPPMQPGPGVSGGRRGDAFDPAENPYAPGSPRVLGSTPTQPAPASGPGGRRGGDAFDPSENPYAPGSPRTLGSTPPQPPPPNTRPGTGPTPYATGAPGTDPGYGRAAGADDPRYGRPPAGPPPGGAGAAYPAVATAAPPPSGSGSPREVYDAGVTYLQRRDYAAAEQSFRDFLSRYPTDRMAAEAQFSLGESLYQRQNYQEAADAFLQMSKKYENSAKAPDALLRLGQSLVALNDKELACVAFADVGRKYPHARSDVKQAIERELKRARCS
jgi:tol-pal system protein YbgF